MAGSREGGGPGESTEEGRAQEIPTLHKVLEAGGVDATMAGGFTLALTSASVT